MGRDIEQKHELDIGGIHAWLRMVVQVDGTVEDPERREKIHTTLEKAFQD